MASSARLPALIDALERFYGTLTAPPRDPFALFVWEILSAHATPGKRDAAMAALKRHRALTPDAVWRLPRKKLEESVAVAGPYREQRLNALLAGVSYFRRSPGLPKVIRGPLAAARRSLKGLPQLSEGAAHRMLLFAADRPVLPVDARVARVALRLGYGQRSGAFTNVVRSIRRQTSGELPEEAEAYRRAFVYLAHHGAATCTDTRPHCVVCPVRGECSYFRLKSSD